MTVVNFFFKRNTVKVGVEDLDAEKLLGVVIKDRVKETQNPGLDLKEEIHLSIFGFLSMVLKMCEYNLRVNVFYNTSLSGKLHIIGDFHVVICPCFKTCSIIFSKLLVLTYTVP